MFKRVGVAVLVLSLAGCATRGANYVPLVDMQNKDATQWSADLHDCQAYAKTRMDAAQGAIAGAILGALLGAAIAPRGYGNYAAGQGAMFGMAGGAAKATDNQETITKRCLAGRGYNVLG